MECRPDIHLGDKYIQISIRFSGSEVDSSADVDTCLFQLLVGIPVPYVLVLVICVGIALPEKTNSQTWKRNAQLSRRAVCTHRGAAPESSSGPPWRTGGKEKTGRKRAVSNGRS